ncbi:hypothetical protein [Zhihengliuella salsuginis]|uniref:Small multi-drug export protein n=1 Tax=Zhihengliuella salsuginis TaxID=578222 RepID=A0ABQ3GE80_9MICC|nr:hypothetical protein [Zhihengliuella salsuginis]GHD02864.1 hypothetical protein GCM10008096_08460 [Zhihengliuella salsuginis]
MDIINWLQELAAPLPGWLQSFVIALAGAIPFVESYTGSVIGVVVGLPVWVAVPAAVVGNWICMFLLVTLGAGIQRRLAERSRREPSKGQQKFLRMFNRFGVPGVSLLGQWVLPSQITSMLMVGIGAAKNQVVLWQSISIALWGAGFGTLAVLGLTALGSV